MWITTNVNLPEALIEAQREGRLVVFAGAGVSMGEPSNLPDFSGLADRVGAKVTPRGTGEPLDQYLGRCEHLGVEVQNLVRSILTVPTSQPTALHRELIGLFREPGRVRLVTTNFDGHFKAAADALYGNSAVAIYRAPALPLGRTAGGIIHVHGALDEARHPLVLTDSDFGRAYLTEGWATRFLLDLFLHNTVCFIGYSHGDPTMRYLARALVPGTARFALTPAGQEATWLELGVTPVLYPVQEDPDRHGALSEAVGSWTARARMGALDHEHRIQELVSLRPPTEPDLGDYLRAALRDPVTRVYFFRHARGSHWLGFANEAGALDGLFGTEAANGEALAPLATWLANFFMLDQPHDLLSIMRAKGMRIGQVLWQTLAWQLWVAKPRPSPELLARWATVLVTTHDIGWPSRWLCQILRACPAEALPAALVLFAHLIQPKIRIRDPWVGLEEDDETVPRLRLEVSPVGDDQDVREAWQAMLRPELERCHRAVAADVTASLTRAHQLLVGAGSGDDGWDQISFGRSAIEPHREDAYPSDMDIVIDIARDVLEFELREHPADADARIALWERSGPPILRRLAIHGRTEKPRVVPSEELERVIANGWLKDTALKHEVFRLVSRAYAEADEPTRAVFLAKALA